MPCGEWSIVAYNGKTIKGFPLKCRAWNCPNCFDFRLWQLKKLAERGRPTTFITLTASVKHWPDKDEAAQAMVVAWRNILQRAEREGLMSGCEYLAVFEETEQGYPHLHILSRMPYVEQKWLSDRMEEYMKSPIVDIRHVYSKKQAARYIAKYISKGPGRFKGTKRYWTSRGWDLEKVDKGKVQRPAGQWCCVVKKSMSEIMRSLSWDGWNGTLDPDGRGFECIPEADARFPYWPGYYTYMGQYPPTEKWLFVLEDYENYYLNAQ